MSRTLAPITQETYPAGPGPSPCPVSPVAAAISQDNAAHAAALATLEAVEGPPVQGPVPPHIFPNRPRKRRQPRERHLILTFTNGRCGYCGVELNNRFEVDHMVPLYRGGTDDLSNFIAACKSCNYLKDTFLVEEFRKQIAKYPERLYRDEATFRAGLRFKQIKCPVTPVVFYFERLGEAWTNRLATGAASIEGGAA